MNKAELTGRLTDEPRISWSKGNEPICIANYTLAVDRRFKREGDQQADFINCVVFGKKAEFARDYFRKGMKVGVIGRIETGQYLDRNGQKVYTTKINVEEQEFEESKAAQERRNAGASTDQGQQQSPPQDYYEDGFVPVPEYDDEPPFQDWPQ